MCSIPSALDAWAPGQRDTINVVLRRAVAAHGERIYLDIAGQTHTYAQMWHQV